MIIQDIPLFVEIEISVVLLGAVFVFCLSQYCLAPTVLERWCSKNQEGQSKAYFFSKISSGVLWIFSSLIFLNMNEDAFQILFPPLSVIAKDLLYACVLFVLLFPFFWIASKRPSVQAQYPELRIKERSQRLVLMSAVSWFVYLVGYEFLFRGVILLCGIAEWGIWNGVGVMTALYVLAHLDKSADETFACFFAGPIFAFATIWDSSIWIAIFLHVFVAVGTENLAAKNNPDFHMNV